MDVVVRGRNVRVPERLRGIAREKLAKVSRFTHDATRIEVEFSELRRHRAGENQLCEVTVHLKRHLVRAHAAAREAEAALDLVIEKVEHQAARIKDKRVARTHPRRRRGRRSDSLGPIADVDDDSDGEGPRIVKTKQFTMKPMGPEEAALQMDLLGYDFFLFTNAENGHAAVLYRRRDGDLGLIEPTG